MATPDCRDVLADAHDATVGRRRFLGLSVAASVGGGAIVLGGGDQARAATLELAEATKGVDTVAEAREAAQAAAWGGHPNGQIPAASLTPVLASVSGSGYLRSDAARQYLSMSLAFSSAVGRPLTITEGYRSYSRQLEYWNKYQAGTGNLAAYPGTSNHGWGISCDFGAGVQTAGSSAKRWMDANAPSYGWRPTGNGFSRPEPWHFDYVGAWTGEADVEALRPDQVDVLLLRCTQALTEAPAGFTALVGFHSLRHLGSIDQINAMRVVGVPYREVSRAQFYDVINVLGIARRAIKTDSDYWRP